MLGQDVLNWTHEPLKGIPAQRQHLDPAQLASDSVIEGDATILLKSQEKKSISVARSIDAYL
jgi:hypothetical protein